jgi:hypothetical protein
MLKNEKVKENEEMASKSILRDRGILQNEFISPYMEYYWSFTNYMAFE